ncbi:MAG: c-type cytochrome [Rhodospirillaceae bacterium]|jgi:cytochrome c553|nr:c-type cytochrome [Rhodospirillaceae bacterium]MBT4219208.1 c-type cytochrome [Rhodospirillaceae bacterium]MBT5014541.1 c-type cytochrome [Rhodospirillaceae bacterium]MBT5309269.1 c-type cytochrome [Rhodospirillaceae bacterium]MBT6405963.1 c-type cytochrome [Rhodospirillaceae bacterium]
MTGMRRLAAVCAVTAALLYPALLSAADLELGEEIFEICAPCHGPFGQGGGAGVYPRLAGMSEDYVKTELRRFKTRRRENIPMLPYATERELPDEDVDAVAAYIATLKLATHLPPMEEGTDALDRLLQAKMTLNVPRAVGNLENGRKNYKEGCSRCHGRTGKGSPQGPLLAGQHTRYLRHQIEKFIAGEREHKSVDILFSSQPEDVIRDMLAHLSILDDPVDEDEDDD